MLGPWPQRAINLVALAPLGFLVVLLPWRIPSVRAALTENKNARLEAENTPL